MQPRPNDEKLMVDPRAPKNVKKIMIPKPNPKATKKVVEMPVAKKKPIKNPTPVFMPTVAPKPRTGGGIVGPTGRNVNSIYNTY
jgi:hypothetical protein